MTSNYSLLEYLQNMKMQSNYKPIVIKILIEKNKQQTTGLAEVNDGLFSFKKEKKYKPLYENIENIKLKQKENHLYNFLYQFQNPQSHL